MKYKKMAINSIVIIGLINVANAEVPSNTSSNSIRGGYQFVVSDYKFNSSSKEFTMKTSNVIGLSGNDRLLPEKTTISGYCRDNIPTITKINGFSLDSTQANIYLSNENNIDTSCSEDHGGVYLVTARQNISLPKQMNLTVVPQFKPVKWGVSEGKFNITDVMSNGKQVLIKYESNADIPVLLGYNKNYGMFTLSSYQYPTVRNTISLVVDGVYKTIFIPTTQTAGVSVYQTIKLQ